MCKCSFDPVDSVSSLAVLDNIKRFHRDSCGEDFVIVYGWFYDGIYLVKEGVVLLKRGESGNMLFIKVDIDGEGSSKFSFVPKKMDRCFSESSILVVNCYHIYVTTIFHRKLFTNGGC